MELDLEGTNGELRAGYQSAGTLAAFRVSTIGPDLFRVDAVGVRVHPVWFKSRNLTFVMPRGETVAWEWPVEGSVPAPADDDEDARITFHVAGDPRPRRR